jgi:uracil-DNA glycosylase family 4
MSNHRENNQVMFMSPWQRFVAKWRDCQECPLCTQRTNIVLARGKIPCDVLFVGEAPGQSEDVLGLPFVGPAGRLLDQIVHHAMPRDEVADNLGAPDPWLLSWAFTNVVCCFPREAKQTDDHRPEVDEIEACRPRLQEFIDLCRPKLLVMVGDTAARHGPDLLPSHHMTHPAALLRLPLAQRDMAIRRQVVQLSEALQELVASQREQAMNGA